MAEPVVLHEEVDAGVFEAEVLCCYCLLRCVGLGEDRRDATISAYVELMRSCSEVRKPCM